MGSTGSMVQQLYRFEDSTGSRVLQVLVFYRFYGSTGSRILQVPGFYGSSSRVVWFYRF